MNFILHPWQHLLMILAVWMNSEQQKINDFYRAQLEAVMNVQGKKRWPLTDDPRGQRKIPRTKDPGGTDYHRDTRSDLALASKPRDEEMG